MVQIWKDTADATVYVITEVEAENAATAHGSALETIGSLPMGASGELIIEEARSVIPYKEWAEYLAGRCSQGIGEYRSDPEYQGYAPSSPATGT